MVEVRVICAIGKHGQLGLNGRLPWEGRRNSIFRDDIQRFFALTRGHVLIAGPRTISSLPDWARSNERCWRLFRGRTRRNSEIGFQTGSCSLAAARSFGTLTLVTFNIGMSCVFLTTVKPTVISILIGYAWDRCSSEKRLRFMLWSSCWARAHFKLD